MWRVCVIVLTAYNYGHPNLESVRPTALNLPLANFHNDMEAAVGQGIQKLEYGKEQFIAYVQAGTERVQAKFDQYFGKS